MISYHRLTKMTHTLPRLQAKELPTSDKKFYKKMNHLTIENRIANQF